MIAESAPKMVAEKQRGRIFSRPRGTQDGAFGLRPTDGTSDAPITLPVWKPRPCGAGLYRLGSSVSGSLRLTQRELDSERVAFLAHVPSQTTVAIVYSGYEFLFHDERMILTAAGGCSLEHD